MIYPYLILLLAGMLVPVVTSAEGLPHGLRSIGLIAPIFMVAGAAASVCVYWLKRRLQDPWRAVGFGVVIGLVIVGSLYDGALYFLIARNDAQAYVAYRGDLTDVANYISYLRQQEPEGERPYLVLDGFSRQTVHYLISRTAPEHFVPIEPQVSHLIFLQPSQRIIFTQSSMGETKRYTKEHPEAKIVEQRWNRWGQEVMRVYQGESSAEKVPVDSLDA